MIHSIGIDWGFAGETTRIVVLEKGAEGTSVKHHENVCAPYGETVERVACIIETYPKAAVACDFGGRVSIAAEALCARLPDRKIELIALTKLIEAKFQDAARAMGLPLGSPWDTAVYLAVHVLPKEYKGHDVKRTS